MWLLSPSIAYNFSQLIEAHAVDTYGEFRDANEQLLKTLPPPQIAMTYYCGEDMYYFDEFQSAQAKGARRPKVENLHDGELGFQHLPSPTTTPAAHPTIHHP